MGARARDRIHHDPQCVIFRKKYAAAVNALPDAPIPVMLSFADGPFGVIFEPQKAGFGRVQRLELADVEHLVLAVDPDRVVTAGAQKVIVPATGTL